jgi:hypothetical protein
MQTFLNDWAPWLAGGAAVVLILAIRHWYGARPHKFKAEDGAQYTWYPGYSFSDHQGAAVTDPAQIAQLSLDWDERARRTERQTGAIMRWRFVIMGIIAIAGVGAGGFALFSQPKADDLDCDRISQEAKANYASIQPPIDEIADLREVSRIRGDNPEVRCTGQARFADGTEGPLYMRAYSADGNTVIWSSGSGFE